jgi:hypothetical protein
VRKIRAEAKWDNAKLVTPSAIIPRILHHGRMEDDLIYAKDRAIYIKTSQP